MVIRSWQYVSSKRIDFFRREKRKFTEKIQELDSFFARQLSKVNRLSFGQRVS